MKCDVIAAGIVGAVRDIGLTMPLVVRLEGTNVEKGKEILAASGFNITPPTTSTTPRSRRSLRSSERRARTHHAFLRARGHTGGGGGCWAGAARGRAAGLTQGARASAPACGAGLNLRAPRFDSYVHDALERRPSAFTIKEPHNLSSGRSGPARRRRAATPSAVALSTRQVRRESPFLLGTKFNLLRRRRQDDDAVSAPSTSSPRWPTCSSAELPSRSVNGSPSEKSSGRRAPDMEPAVARRAARLRVRALHRDGAVARPAVEHADDAARAHDDAVHARHEVVADDDVVVPADHARGERGAPSGAKPGAAERARLPRARTRIHAPRATDKYAPALEHALDAPAGLGRRRRARGAEAGGRARARARGRARCCSRFRQRVRSAPLGLRARLQQEGQRRASSSGARAPSRAAA